MYNLGHLLWQRGKSRLIINVECMIGSRKFSQGGAPSGQGWSNKLYHCKNPNFGKSRGGGGAEPPIPPLDPPMEWGLSVLSQDKIESLECKRDRVRQFWTHILLIHYSFLDLLFRSAIE